MGTGERLVALEQRVARLEDELAIRHLLASYGPAVDSNESERASALWTESGVYDTDLGRHEGRGEIEAMLAGDFHQGLLAAGCAHVVSNSKIDVAGDEAIATGYMQLLRREGDGFQLIRLTAHRWKLVREAGTWRVHDRTTRLLDGREVARELLRGAEFGCVTSRVNRSDDRGTSGDEA